MLSIRNISAGYSKNLTIIRNVSFELTEGEILGIIGKNGCGKSTLLKALLGLAPYRTGKIFLFDKDISNSSSEHIAKTGLIGYLPQRDRIFQNLSVYENVLIPYFGKKKIHRKGADQIFTKEIFGDLLHYKNTCASFLSGGQALLLALACLVLYDPPIFYLDEPSDGLDNNKKTKLIELLNELRELKKGIIMVEQNVEILNELNSDIYSIEEIE
jgi:branched-chain amino acid transport system ATP-binding protein